MGRPLCGRPMISVLRLLITLCFVLKQVNQITQELIHSPVILLNIEKFSTQLYQERSRATVQDIQVKIFKKYLSGVIQCQ